MAAYYFDASALVKYYILEPGSTWVRSIINTIDAQSAQPANIIFVADISVAEVAAAFAILSTGTIFGFVMLSRSEASPILEWEMLRCGSA